MSLPQTYQIADQPDVLDVFSEASADTTDMEGALAILALTHSVTEHRVYLAMLRETLALNSRVVMVTMTGLADLAGLCSFNTVRHAVAGLKNKLSIERQQVLGDDNRRYVYLVFTPAEIFARRRAAGRIFFHKDVMAYLHNPAARLTVRRSTENFKLTARETHVALLCTEGLSNSQIAERLCVSEQTIKFHLKSVFLKCGVKRRTELVSRLLSIQ